MPSEPTLPDSSAELLARGMRELESLGLNHGTAGNLSIRTPEGFMVTPSGVATAALSAEQMVPVDADGQPLVAAPAPSSEWRFHCDIYRQRSDVGAIVHVHSPYATALACQRREIPAFHYMVAVAGGDNIRCAPYALFGTQALSDGALAALQGRRACLLANHGMISVGTTVSDAIALAVEVEQLARHYNLSSTFGAPTLLSIAEMEAVLERFKTYGARHGCD